MHTKKRLGFFIFEGVTALDFIGPAEAFAIASEHQAASTRRAAYEIVTVGVERRACVSESGVTLVPGYDLERVPPLDTLIVPGGHGLRRPEVTEKLGAWLRRRAPRIRRVASVCTGIYGLAASGLLDGRRVATHWRFCADVASRFPKLDVSEDELFVKDGRFYTAAGVTAGIDLALGLIEDDLGPRASLAVAREMVVYVKRSGGQAQFSEPLQFQSLSETRLGELAAHIASRLREPLDVPSLARKFGLSPRQLSRRCREELGSSPAALVARLRLDEARRRLANRDTSVDEVASSVGFGSADAFRRAFERKFGLNPSAYRERFRAVRRRAGRRRLSPDAARSGHSS